LVVRTPATACDQRFKVRILGIEFLKLVVRSSLGTFLHGVALVKVIKVYLWLKYLDLSIFGDGKAPIDEVKGISINIPDLKLFALALILHITDSSEMLLAFILIRFSPLVEVLCVSLLGLLLWLFIL